jgi:hypothetical protein
MKKLISGALQGIALLLVAAIFVLILSAALLGLLFYPLVGQNKDYQEF